MKFSCLSYLNLMLCLNLSFKEMDIFNHILMNCLSIINFNCCIIQFFVSKFDRLCSVIIIFLVLFDIILVNICFQYHY